MKNKFGEFLLFAIGAVGLGVLVSLLLSIPVWLLWNWLMPVIFDLKVITVWQAWGLLVLSGLLFNHSSSSSSKK